jgi:glutaminyl-tRNA synthetase
LRAKIDMTSTNMLMRDPLMYRVLHRHHHRTGNDWKIYPMYDFAHGESDYIEQISHSICTICNAQRIIQLVLIKFMMTQK